MENITLLPLVLERLTPNKSKWPDSKGEYWAICPFHNDTTPNNFSVNSENYTYNCFACGNSGHLTELARHLGIESITNGLSNQSNNRSFPVQKKKRDLSKVVYDLSTVEKNENTATHKPSEGLVSLSTRNQGGTNRGGMVAEQLKYPIPELSLDIYAESKHLPKDYLSSLGLTVITKYPVQQENGKTYQKVLSIPYMDENGQIIGIRYRITMKKTVPDVRFRWKSGVKVKNDVGLYGRWKKREIQEAGWVIVVEGESDAQTLWYHGVPAIGIPGANMWDAKWASFFDGLEVYVWQEPDAGGETIVSCLEPCIENLKIINPPEGLKDISDIHVSGLNVVEVVEELKARAHEYIEPSVEDDNEAVERAEQYSQFLLQSDNVLDEVLRVCRERGVVGEENNLKFLYLAMTSRLLPKIVSAVIKGSSSSGKSYVLRSIMDLFPDSAYYNLTSASPKALYYLNEPFSHRFLVLMEADGLSEEMEYIVRTLLSEGKISYDTVEKVDERLQVVRIDTEGPTGLLTTTTRPYLHRENETRFFSLNTQDNETQTKSVLEREAYEAANMESYHDVDVTPFVDYQKWLEIKGNRNVVVPFIQEIADKTLSNVPRLRRDFSALISLIRSHAILHQQSREVDKDGNIIATIEDYAVVYELVNEVMDYAAGESVKPAVREVVEVIGKMLFATGRDTVRPSDVIKKMDGEKSKPWVYSNVKIALAEGYLLNDGNYKNKELRLGDPLPDDKRVLPAPHEIGVYTPPQSTPPNQRRQLDKYEPEPTVSEETVFLENRQVVDKSRQVGNNGDFRLGTGNNQNETKIDNSVDKKYTEEEVDEILDTIRKNTE